MKMKNLIQRIFSSLALFAGLNLLLNGIPSRAATSTITLSTPGNYTWTCPAGVTSVTVECWGGGGGGGGVGANYSEAGGGAGGAFAIYTSLSVTPGTTYNLTVGAGGAGGTGGAANTGGNGGAGGSSYFGNTTAGNSSGASVLAVGGPGGALNNIKGSSSSYSGNVAGGTAAATGNIPSSGAIYGSNGGATVTGTKSSGAGGNGGNGGTGGASITSARMEIRATRPVVAAAAGFRQLPLPTELVARAVRVRS